MKTQFIALNKFDMYTVGGQGNTVEEAVNDAAGDELESSDQYVVYERVGVYRRVVEFVKEED